MLPLSSKSHWDVPVRIGNVTLHLLASHPTPPAFDGAEDRNGRRNHDEIRFWSDYLTRGSPATSATTRAGAAASAARPSSSWATRTPIPSTAPACSDAHRGAARESARRCAVRAAERGRRRSQRRAGRRQCRATRRSALRHRGLQRSRRRQPARRLSTAVEGHARSAAAACSGQPQADPAASLVWGDRPPPSSDHRLVWLDVSVRRSSMPTGQ